MYMTGATTVVATRKLVKNESITQSTRCRFRGRVGLAAAFAACAVPLFGREA
jgi:hypothetical protein